MRVVLLAAAVALAGCPAFGGSQSTETRTVTPVPVPDQVSYPPGMGPTGVEDPVALARAHSRIVANTSYTLVSNRTVTAANGSLRSRLAVRTRLARDRTYYVTARTGGPAGPEFLGPPPSRAEFWSNGTVYLRAIRGPNGTVVNRFQPPNEFVASWRYWRSTVSFGGQEGHARQTLVSLFGSVDTTVATRRTSNGTTRFFLVGTRALDSNFAQAGTGPIDGVRLEATVREDGLVESFRLGYRRGSDTGELTVRWRLRYVNVGSTSVAGPPWPVEPQTPSTTSTATPS